MFSNVSRPQSLRLEYFLLFLSVLLSFANIVASRTMSRTVLNMPLRCTSSLQVWQLLHEVISIIFQPQVLVFLYKKVSGISECFLSVLSMVFVAGDIEM